MKRYFILLSVMILALLLSACGGTSNSTAAKNAISITTKSSLLSTAQDKLSVQLLVTNQYDSQVGVTLSDFSIDVTTCGVKDLSITPTTIDFSQLDSSSASVSAIVSFNDSCIPTAYKLNATNRLSLNGDSNILHYSSPAMALSFGSDSNTTHSGTDTNTNTDTTSEIYAFFNQPDTITVDKPDTTYPFQIQLIDSDRKGVAGQTISALAFDSKFGSLTNMSATTDQNGFAEFIFVSPASLSVLNEESLTLSLIQGSGNAQITTNVDLSFSSSTTTSSSDYAFQNPSSISVSQASEELSISIDLVDEKGVGVSGKTLQILNIASQYGSFASATAQTDAAGKARFTYTGPGDIDAVDGQSTTTQISFTESGQTITQEVAIRFNKADNNTELDTTLPTVVIPNTLHDITLTSNSKTIEIPISVYKNITPYTNGTVYVELPSKVLNGVDVGSFSSFAVPVNELGVATFNYTGPSNLKALVDNNDTGSTFKFYHSENSTAESKQSMNVSYDITDNAYIPIDYTLSVTTQDSDFSMGIPQLQKTFSVVLKDTEGNLIDENDINITRITAQTENALIAQLFNTVTKTSVNTLELAKENNSAFVVKSKQLSGIVPIHITMEFTDINSEAKSLSTIVNLRVMSGPPSAISMTYLGTRQDTINGKYEENFAISVTDEYGNQVNTQPNISLGAIIGYAVDGRETQTGTNLDGNPIAKETNSTKRLFYGMSDVSSGLANGHIDAQGDSDAQTTKFYDNIPTDVFKYINAEGNNTDKLVVFGLGKNYEAMGKWDIERIDGNYNTIKLLDDYFGTNRDQLFYAVGHNYYQDQCYNDGREWIGIADSDNYQLNEQGTATIRYKYDYHLTGKEAMIWINLNGQQADTGENTRIGEVLKHTLRGNGLTKLPSAGYALVANSPASTVSFSVWHTNISEAYRNGHFQWRVKEGSSCRVIGYTSSNDYDARTCNNGVYSNGASYVNVTIATQEDNASCTFDIDIIGVANEF